MKSLTANELKRKLDTKDDLVLVNVLDQSAFEQEHIAGSYNVPNSQPDLVSRIEQLAGRKDRQIIVYCANKACHASPEAGQKLERAGFTNVSHYAGGIEEWMQLGHPVEHGALATA